MGGGSFSVLVTRGWGGGGGGSGGGTFLNPFSAQQCEEPFDVGQGNVRRGGTGSFPRVFVELCEQNRHGWAFINKDADIALRLSQRQGQFQRHKSSSDVALHLVGERLQHQGFDDASRPLPFFRCVKEALQESHCLKHGAVCTLARIPGQEHPGQGDVLELAQVAEVVLNGEAMYTRSASPSRSSAPSRSPWASRMRAIATRQRYRFCDNSASTPSSLLRSRSSVAGCS